MNKKSIYNDMKNHKSYCPRSKECYESTYCICGGYAKGFPDFAARYNSALLDRVKK